MKPESQISALKIPSASQVVSSDPWFLTRQRLYRNQLQTTHSLTLQLARSKSLSYLTTQSVYVGLDRASIRYEKEPLKVHVFLE